MELYEIALYTLAAIIAITWGFFTVNSYEQKTQTQTFTQQDCIAADGVIESNVLWNGALKLRCINADTTVTIIEVE